MRFRGAFVADGPSDLPLARVLELACFDHGLEIDITAIPPTVLKGRTLAQRLAQIPDMDQRNDVLFVHRDAESQDPQLRYDEVIACAPSSGVTHVVAVVPVHMTEAWLLLDEDAIRSVAGKPRGRDPLGLPTVTEVERLADPKALLADVLLAAAGVSGRRRDNFRRDFGRRREQLIDRIDRHGPITQLTAWRRLIAQIETVATRLSST